LATRITTQATGCGCSPACSRLLHTHRACYLVSLAPALPSAAASTGAAPSQDAATTAASDFSYGDGDGAADELAELLASMLPSEAAAASAAARAAAAAVVNAAYARATGADAASFARIQRAITNPQARPPARRLAAARGLLPAFGIPRAPRFSAGRRQAASASPLCCCSCKLSCAIWLSVYAEGRALRVPNGMGHIWKSSGDYECVVGVAPRSLQQLSQQRGPLPRMWVAAGARRLLAALTCAGCCRGACSARLMTLTTIPRSLAPTPQSALKGAGEAAAPDAAAGAGDSTHCRRRACPEPCVPRLHLSATPCTTLPAAPHNPAARARRTCWTR